MRLPNRNPASTADYLVTINGLPDTYWESVTGGEVQHNRPMFSDGLTAQKRRARQGSKQYTDVTMSMSFDPDVDNGVIDWLVQYGNSGEYFQALVRPVYRNNDIEFRGAGRAFRLVNCRILSHNAPGDIDTNSNGEDVSRITLTASIEDKVYTGGLT